MQREQLQQPNRKQVEVPNHPLLHNHHHLLLLPLRKIMIPVDYRYNNYRPLFHFLHPTQLQIRLFGGKTLVQSFPATQTLIDVNRYILANRTDDNTPYNLMTTYPRHVFVPDEMNKSLKELGQYNIAVNPIMYTCVSRSCSIISANTNSASLKAVNSIN